LHLPMTQNANAAHFINALHRPKLSDRGRCQSPIAPDGLDTELEIVCYHPER
jgi:hypothetical protein